MLVLLHDLSPVLGLTICAFLLRLHDTAAWAAEARENVHDAVAFEIVLSADVGELHGLEDPACAEAGGEVKEEALGEWVSTVV